MSNTSQTKTRQPRTERLQQRLERARSPSPRSGARDKLAPELMYESEETAQFNLSPGELACHAPDVVETIEYMRVSDELAKQQYAHDPRLWRRARDCEKQLRLLDKPRIEGGGTRTGMSSRKRAQRSSGRRRSARRRGL